MFIIIVKKRLKINSRVKNVFIIIDSFEGLIEEIFSETKNDELGPEHYLPFVNYSFISSMINRSVIPYLIFQ